MQKVWPLNEAKANFEEVVQCALAEGPQIVSRHDQDVVVVISCSDYDRLRQGKPSLVDFLRNSPLRGMDFDGERPRDLPRDEPLFE